jgi:hypothetical protein
MCVCGFDIDTVNAIEGETLDCDLAAIETTNKSDTTASMKADLWPIVSPELRFLGDW